MSNREKSPRHLHSSMMFPGAQLLDLVTPDGDKPRYFDLELYGRDVEAIEVTDWTYPRLCYSTQAVISGDYSRRLSPTCWMPQRKLLEGLMLGTPTCFSIVVPDLLNLQVFVRDDGTSLLLINHSTIIGSRWLTVVSAESLPWA